MDSSKVRISRRGDHRKWPRFGGPSRRLQNAGIISPRSNQSAQATIRSHHDRPFPPRALPSRSRESTLALTQPMRLHRGPGRVSWLKPDRKDRLLPQRPVDCAGPAEAPNSAIWPRPANLVAEKRAFEDGSPDQNHHFKAQWGPPNSGSAVRGSGGCVAVCQAA